MHRVGLSNLFQNIGKTARRKAGIFEAWAASILLLWVVIAIACWSL